MSKWKTVKLGEVGVIITGNTPKTSDKENYLTNDISFYRPSDIVERNVSYLNSSEAYVSEVARSKVRMLPKGSILVTCIGIIGKIGILEHEATFNQQINAIIPNQDICLNRYIAYSIFFNRDRLRDIANAPVVPIVNKTQFSNMIIPLPPLEEQKRIADILDKASNLIELRKQQLEKMDLLIKSKFIDMFGDPVTNSKGWEVKSLKDIALGKLSYGSGASATEYDLNVRYIRITDINEKGCLNVHKVSPNEISDEYILSEGDILFARSGATVGKTFRYSEKYGKCIYAGYLIRLVPNQKIVLPDYIYYLTKTDYYLSFVQQSMKTVAQPNINAQQYGALQIPIPPIFLQNQFAAFVEQVEKQKAVMQQSLEKMETNYKALMQEYFG